MQLDESVSFERKEKFLRHIFFWALPILMLLTVLGLLGSGGFLAKKVIESENYKLSHDRILRKNANSRIIISSKQALEADAQPRLDEGISQNIRLLNIFRTASNSEVYIDFTVLESGPIDGHILLNEEKLNLKFYSLP